MVRKNTQRARGREPEAEELDFIFRRLHRGLSITEIKIDLAEQKFIPLRGDAFYYRLRREFDAAKKVISIPQQATLNHLGLDARKEHLDDLLNVVVKWDNEIGNDVNGQEVSWESLVPSTFSVRDRNLGDHKRGSIGWQVTEDQTAETTEQKPVEVTEVRDVEVWMLLDGRELLFQPLLEHISVEHVGEIYDSLKAKLREMIYFLKSAGKLC